MVDLTGGIVVQLTGAGLTGSVAGALLLLAAVAAGAIGWRRSRRDLAATQQALADAQAQAHRLQLQPHFVFNALQAAATLVHRDAAGADLMLVALGDFLRLTMQSAESREIPLVTELALLDRYVEVMRYRFGDQVRVVVEADPETLDARVPQLLLQPLVENAIRHGLRGADETVHVHVRVLRRGDALLCLVRDDGKGLMPPVRGPGIGLRSTRGRLQAMYGTRGQFDLANHPDGGVAATVTLPFHTLPDERAA